VGELLLALQIPRPVESIISIYCPWHPETSASPIVVSRSLVDFESAIWTSHGDS
jgi:hypothetical protein